MRIAEWLVRPGPARVEPLGSAHAAALADIHAAAFARPWSALEFERLLADERVVADGLFFARKRDPVGFATSRVVAGEAEVLSIALAREARGRGCAAPLLQRHLESLARHGVAQLHLEVEDGNAPALALYRRFGFAEVGRRSGYYLRPDGSRAAALTMTRAL